jgi:hypothetical protein
LWLRLPAAALVLADMLRSATLGQLGLAMAFSPDDPDLHVALEIRRGWIFASVVMRPVRTSRRINRSFRSGR